jgi:putative redox protein
MALIVLATFVDPSTGLRVEATAGSGFSIVMDADDADMPATAATPREALLAALAGCTAMDVASILRKKRQQASTYRISAVAETRRDVHPHVFTKVVIEHQVDGRVEVEALRRSIELSATRYCPLIAMLSASVTIEHRYRLREEGADTERTALVLVTGPAAA